MSERKLFGTDGVRDIANTGRMTSETALRLGRAYVKSQGVMRVVVGTDTRISSGMLECALVSGLSSEGAEVIRCSVMPTPGVSYAVKALGADGGAVISASHNPAEYNGIKFLGSDGCKLRDAEELAVERALSAEPSTSRNIGRIYARPELVGEYAAHIGSLLNPDAVISGVVIDCANGAGAVSVPYLIQNSALSGSDVRIISQDYDGLNINDKCGVMHMESLTEYVKSTCRSIGFALDGDADRVLICDGLGRVIDGDIILWVLGRWLKAETGNAKVAATVMSNKALDVQLSRAGIEVLRCPVGDRYVLESMRESGAGLGGEQSGHIIASDFTSTGDGLCTAVLFMNAVKALNEEVNTLIERFGRYPQRLTNIKLTRSREEIDMSSVEGIADEYRARVTELGRIYIRTSGTEPLLRILVEAPEDACVEEVSRELTSRLTEYC